MGHPEAAPAVVPFVVEPGVAAEVAGPAPLGELAVVGVAEAAAPGVVLANLLALLGGGGVSSVGVAPVAAVGVLLAVYLVVGVSGAPPTGGSRLLLPPRLAGLLRPRPQRPTQLVPARLRVLHVAPGPSVVFGSAPLAVPGAPDAAALVAGGVHLHEGRDLGGEHTLQLPGGVEVGLAPHPGMAILLPGVLSHDIAIPRIIQLLVPLRLPPQVARPAPVRVLPVPRVAEPAALRHAEAQLLTLLGAHAVAAGGVAGRDAGAGDDVDPAV
mmetsp:Transcript_62021/g.142759  ORF Transcript_62021/g.142759 Transcript_62021/m.142759 type:complete len:269 (-) Transcript_62021:230-1036(-)